MEKKKPRRRQVKYFSDFCISQQYTLTRQSRAIFERFKDTIQLLRLNARRRIFRLTNLRLGPRPKRAGKAAKRQTAPLSRAAPRAMSLIILRE